MSEENPNAAGNYGGRPIASLTGRQLDLAEKDVAACLERVNAAPDLDKRLDYKARLEQQAEAIAAEKQGRGL